MHGATCYSLSPLGRDLLPGLLEAVDGSALQPCQDRLQGVVVVELVALAGNLHECHEGTVCRIEGLSIEWSNPTELNLPPPPQKKNNNLEMLSKCVSGATQNLRFWAYTHMGCTFNFIFGAIHAISSTSFWVGPLWFSALQF